MGILISNTDFKEGFHQITQMCFDDESLTSYIDTHEKPYLCRLLGNELAELFIDDLDENGVPQTPIYQDLYNPFCEIVDEKCGIKKEYQSFGMKHMMKGFIYSEFVPDQPINNTPSGPQANENANAKNLNTNELFRVSNKRWNYSVFSFEAIQWKINENIDSYPTFNGIELQVKFLDIL